MHSEYEGSCEWEDMLALMPAACVSHGNRERFTVSCYCDDREEAEHLSKETYSPCDVAQATSRVFLCPSNVLRVTIRNSRIMHNLGVLGLVCLLTEMVANVHLDSDGRPAGFEPELEKQMTGCRRNESGG